MTRGQAHNANVSTPSEQGRGVLTVILCPWCLALWGAEGNIILRLADINRIIRSCLPVSAIGTKGRLERGRSLYAREERVE